MFGFNLPSLLLNCQNWLALVVIRSTHPATDTTFLLLTFVIVWSTWCTPPVVCSCRYIGGLLCHPQSFLLYMLLSSKYIPFLPLSLHLCFVFQQVMDPVLENEVGIWGWRQKGHIFVVIWRKEAYIEEKIGGDKEAPQCIYIHEQTTGSAHQVDCTMANVNTYINTWDC